MAKFRIQFAPNTEHYIAIGRIAVLWSSLEKTIESFVWQLSDLKSPYAQCITTHLQTMTLIDIVNSMAYERLLNTELDVKLKSQLQKINNELRPKRNKIVLGVWASTNDIDSISLVEVSARGVYKFDIGEEYTSDDLIKIAQEIDVAHSDLTDLIFEISDYFSKK